MSERIKVIMLGSGTSFGVPIPCCNCETCSSEDPRNKRTRVSLYFENSQTRCLIDTSKDLWQQCVNNRIDDVDRVFYTHSHADHILGIDDLRFMNIRNNKVIEILGREETIDHIKDMFKYIFEAQTDNCSKPHISVNFFQDERRTYGGIDIEAITLDHECMLVNGYIIQDKLAYLTDFKRMSKDLEERIKGIDILIVGCIRYKSHTNHMGFEETMEFIDRIKPKKTYLTHTSHLMNYDKVNAQTPENVEMGYDGLTIVI